MEVSGIVHEDSEFVELACETWFSLCCAVRGRLPAHTAKDYQLTDNLNFISPFGVHCTHTCRHSAPCLQGATRTPLHTSTERSSDTVAHATCNSLDGARMRCRLLRMLGHMPFRVYMRALTFARQCTPLRANAPRATLHHSGNAVQMERVRPRTRTTYLL